MDQVQDTKEKHAIKANYLKDCLARNNYNATFVPSKQLKKEDLKDKDTIIVFGGDHQYLKTAMFLEDSTVNFIGINSSRDMTKETLC
jgi:NAD kinase